MKKKCILVVAFLIALIALGGCGRMKLNEDAEIFKVYSELPEDITNAFINDFEKDHKGKLKIEIVKTAAKQGPGRINELKSLDFDVWLGGTAEDYFLADNRRMLKPYEAKDLRNIPTGLRDKHGTWTGLFTTNLVFLANKKALAEVDEERPQAWSDLLDLELRRNIIISDPSMRQGGYRILTTFWQLYGEKKFETYAKNLKLQELTYARDDEAAVEAVRKGEKALTIVTLDLAMSAAAADHNLVISIPADGTSRKLIGVAIMDKTKKEALSRSFIDYLISDKAKKVLDNSNYYVWPLSDDKEDYTWGKPYADVFLVHDDLRWCVLTGEEIIEKLQTIDKQGSLLLKGV
ncbi:MAG: extracellular solute-binding protein [Acidaminococcaceae bacterium]